MRASSAIVGTVATAYSRSIGRILSPTSIALGNAVLRLSKVASGSTRLSSAGTGFGVVLRPEIRFMRIFAMSRSAIAVSLCHNRAIHPEAAIHDHHIAVQHVAA